MEKYIPNFYQKSIYTINYSALYSLGIRTLFFDLDNTLIPVHNKEIPIKTKELIIHLKQKGFKVFILSNSPFYKVKKYKKYFDVDGESFAFKPLKYKANKLIKKYNINKNELAIIGDQMLTDIALGSHLGITRILVTPLSDEDIFLFGQITRLKEKNIMKKLATKKLFQKGEYYD